MTDHINTGGAAFPSMYDQTFEQNFGHEAGMTLRDCFAAKALTGMNAADRRWEGGTKDMATAAYAQADAMIAARGGAQ